MMLEKTPRTGHIRTLAERVAAHPSIRAAVQVAVESALPGVIEDCLAGMFPNVEGDFISLKLYRRKSTRKKQKERDDRIAAALKAGLTVSKIASMESVSERHVFRVKARALTSSGP